MDTSRTHGLGLRTEGVVKPEAAFSTAPASPTEEMQIEIPTHPPEEEQALTTIPDMSPYNMPPQQSTVAQLSFGPATQQTVTTVTTTTTISLPPLIMKPPNRLEERDPKQYPLAFSPTPSHLKRFCTDVHGRPIQFHEEEDPQETVRKFYAKQAEIQRRNGSLRSEEKQDEYQTPVRGLNGPHINKTVHNVRASHAPKRTATPPSIAEAAEIASLQRRIKKPRSQTFRPSAESTEQLSLNQRVARGEIPVLNQPSPVTPDTDAGIVPPLPPKAGSSSHSSKRRPSPSGLVRSRSRLQEVQNGPMQQQSSLNLGALNFNQPITPPAPEDILRIRERVPSARDMTDDQISAGIIRRKQQQRALYQQQMQNAEDEEVEDMQMADDTLEEEDSQLGPPFYGKQKKKKQRLQFEDDAVVGAPQPSGAAATPPIVETDLEPVAAPVERRRPILPTISTSSQQDASLPSPSLSPITAAANLASRQNAFDASFAAAMSAEDDSMVSGLDLDGDNTTQSADLSFTSQPSGKQSQRSSRSKYDVLQQPSPPANGPTIMDVPLMLDAFDSMDQEMQSYLIYQFLRRCAKPTLQMVANAVNPALKCDPFNMLPVELGMQIIRLLDAQSMCRAAQVSKRWRKHINSDEKAWKDLLERDGFVLPDGEIARAVKEGWGWQHPGEDGFEEDLSKHVSRATPEPHVPLSPPAITVISDDEETASSAVTSRTKRRSVVAKAVTVNKKLKRRSVQVSASATKPSSVSTSARTTLHREIKAAKGGPNALANVAESAIPNPTTGLDSLRGMHLFKSLYQRHYLIRKSWMQEDSQPQHLAFRAHHRHVVTCLLFDSERILTGSDDTKINVYNTKTGALQNRLEGHEGGVWALQYEGDTLVSGSTDRSVRVWDIKTGRCLQVFQGHTSTVRCLVILKPVQVDTAPDGTPIMMPKEPLIITGSRDSTLRVWKLPQPGDRQIFHAGPPARDTDNPYFLRTLSGHHNSVRAIAAHGDTLISGSYDCTVRVWKISNGDLVHRLQGHTQKVYSVVLDHARNRCISGSMDNLVKVWDLTSGACLFNLEGHTSLVGLLDLSHDRLVSAAADSTLRIWDPESGTCKATLSAHTGAITCFQHDGQKVISGSDRTLKMWNVRNGECVKDLLTELSGVWQVRFDERRCVAAVQRNNLTYIEVSFDLTHTSRMPNCC